MSTKQEFLAPTITYGDTLRFTAYAYAKLLWMRDRGDTEVAGYCVTGTSDPLLVTDFKLIKQKCTGVTFDLDTNDLAEYQDSMLDANLAVWQSARILAHTHPGFSPEPSGVDEENFRKAFSSSDWAIMLIISESGATYCRMKMNVGPGVEKQLKVQVDFSQDFPVSNHSEWNAEYKDNVTVEPTFRMTGKELRATQSAFSPNNLNEHPWWDNLEQEAVGFAPNQQLEEQEDETEFDCFWDINGDVVYWNEEESTFYTYDPLNHLWHKDSDEDNGTIEKIEMPQEPWVEKVVEWANENADDRGLALIEEEVCDSGKKEC